jgi:hypothetical protein
MSKFLTLLPESWFNLHMPNRKFRRFCTRCRKTRLIRFFTPDGPDPHNCLSCRVQIKESHARKLRRLYLKFGIPQEAYIAMLKSANYGCEICHRKLAARRLAELGDRWACVDHCHSTGKIRGVLCAQCNAAIGLMSDSIEILENAIKYLQRPAK